MSFERLLFFGLAALALGSAIMTVTRRSPVQSALFLIVNFFCLALLFLSLSAQFIAIAQVLVYAGAIMVLFLFVLMLLNPGDETSFFERINARRIAGAAAGGVIVSLLVIVMRGGGPPGPAALPESFGSVESVGRLLFTAYLVPFEATSLLLLGALVGVIVLAKKSEGSRR